MRISDSERARIAEKLRERADDPWMELGDLCGDIGCDVRRGEEAAVFRRLADLIDPDNIPDNADENAHGLSGRCDRDALIELVDELEKCAWYFGLDFDADEPLRDRLKEASEDFAGCARRIRKVLDACEGDSDAHAAGDDERGGIYAHADEGEAADGARATSMDVLRWVKDHGGLDAVKESVEQSECRKKPLDCFAMRLGFESLEDSGDIFKELEKRLMPEGMEWPRYEDGELVPIGGEFMGKDGKTYTAKQIQFIGKCFSLYDFCDRKPQFSGFYGERVRHPAVPAADGEPLEVGQTVWNINNGMEFTVSRLPKSGEYQAVEVRYRNGSSTSFDPDQLTHQRPVLDADGVPIKAGDTVWHIETGREYVVIEPSYGETVVVRPAGHDDADGEQYAPGQLTRTEPDSWERLEEDANALAEAETNGRGSYNAANAYCNRRGLGEGTSFVLMAQDLVRRCRALAERERGE